MGRSTASKASRSRNDYLAVWGPIVVISLVGFLFAWRYVQPAPPTSLRIASGDESGAYHAFAKQYQHILQRHGISLQVIPSAGSVQNLEMLRNRSVSLALVQGGAAGNSGSNDLESLASLYFEPMWVFFPKTRPIHYLHELRGKRIAIGPERSGTQVLARQLLSDNGIDSKAATLLTLSSEAAAQELRRGTVDAAFFVSSPKADLIDRLLHDESVGLLNFRQSLAYRRKHRFLSSVTLGEGSMDLARNIPPEDIQLLAPAAILVARRDLHPALIPVILETMKDVHDQGAMFSDPGDFPSASYTDFPLNADARRYLRQGPSFLYRYLPFWAASLVDRLKIMLLPLLTLLIPLAKLAPPIYRWRIRSKIYRWYLVLREIDQATRNGLASPGFHAEIERLNTMETEVSLVSVPASYMEEFYNLRMHLDILRDKLTREGARAGATR